MHFLPPRAHKDRLAQRHHIRNLVTLCATDCILTMYITLSLINATKHQRRAASSSRFPVHRASQKHFPPRPCKTAWHSDVANVYNSQCNTKPRCHHTPSRSPATCRACTRILSPSARARNAPPPPHRHAALAHASFPFCNGGEAGATQTYAASTEAARNCMAQRRRNEAHAVRLSSQKPLPAPHVHYYIDTELPSFRKPLPALHLRYKIASWLAGAPRSCCPRYMSTTKLKNLRRE